jgi:preprotein translocase subunit SecA
VNRLRSCCAQLDDDGLTRRAAAARSLPEVVAVTAVVASRVLGLDMYDEQIQAALELAAGHVVEMQTGEGKTLAAVPAIAWLARERAGVHVLTANDYLARRDAEWMRPIYERLGSSVACVTQASPAPDRRAAYRADITYATANEVGFDYLRDGIALSRADEVLRPFAAAVIDEADSMLLDEARVPLVIAGGADESEALVVEADGVVRELVRGRHYQLDAPARNVSLTTEGVAFVERGLGCANLYDGDGPRRLAALQHALHAHTLLSRDIDYVVERGAIVAVDELKGRVVPDRRWPAGLQTALEVKEGVPRQRQGRVLGSITVEHLIALYPRVCGMTGTAAVQAREFREIYGLDVRVVPTHRPAVRVDHPDVLLASLAEKEAAVRREVRAVHATGRPVLVGTSSVQESERLSRSLRDLPHAVLNARHEAAEAAIVERAGERGAVTISTNMAGRGVDIRLGEGVAGLGGLHVIGTNRHESRRIDHQLRGRAGRQGDPGSSRFFVSREDPLVVKFSGGDAGIGIDQLQRVAEGQHLDLRLFLQKYESVIEGQRLATRSRREAILDDPALGDEARTGQLIALDDLWADHLAAVADLRAGILWISLGYGSPFGHYLKEVHRLFAQFERAVAPERLARLAAAQTGTAARRRGATWTYLTTDDPFGPMSQRIARQLAAWLFIHGASAGSG